MLANSFLFFVLKIFVRHYKQGMLCEWTCFIHLCCTIQKASVYVANWQGFHSALQCFKMCRLIEIYIKNVLGKEGRKKTGSPYNFLEIITNYMSGHI